MNKQHQMAKRMKKTRTWKESDLKHLAPLYEPGGRTRDAMLQAATATGRTVDSIRNKCDAIDDALAVLCGDGLPNDYSPPRTRLAETLAALASGAKPKDLMERFGMSWQAARSSQSMSSATAAFIAGLVGESKPKAETQFEVCTDTWALDEDGKRLVCWPLSVGVSDSGGFVLRHNEETVGIFPTPAKAVDYGRKMLAKARGWQQLQLFAQLDAQRLGVQA